MLALTLTQPDPRDPLAAVTLGERPEPTVPEGWTTVRLRAASVNHHDVWSMRGVGVDPDWLPCVLGSDGAGVDEDGNEVIVYPLIATPHHGDETLDPRRRMISDGIDGTFAEAVAVPRANLIPKPPELSWAAAACLPTAWLAAYRMLYGAADLPPGSTVLVQGAGGGLATALTVLGAAGGLRVWVTSRDAAKRERALGLGAAAAFEPGTRLPDRVDAVMESVGRATWAHSVRSLRPGGTLVVAGATTGVDLDPDLSRIFLNQIRVIGSSLGTRDELTRLAALCASGAATPTIDSEVPLESVVEGIGRMVSGELFGKIVVTIGS